MRYTFLCIVNCRRDAETWKERREEKDDVVKKCYVVKLFVKPPPESWRRTRYIYTERKDIGEETGVNFKLDINRHEKVCDTFLPFSSTEVIRARFLEKRNLPVNSATNMDKTREINDREINEGVKPLWDE